jgi:DNA mismatch endonuclease (patch repair protein)
VDQYSPARRSEIMSSIRSRDTRPEILVRQILHRLGYRFRLHRKDLPGRPDIVLPGRRVAILVHGCFWHGCRNCDRGTRIPKTNTDFWLAKIAENQRRDRRVRRLLREAGWRVIVVWACETANEERLANRLAAALAVPTKNGQSSTSSPAVEE